MNRVCKWFSAGLAGVFLITALSACTDSEPTGPATLTVDLNDRHQTMEGFGASSAWWSQEIGGWTDTGASGKQVREEIMDLLYSEDGLGLNIYRYNLGAGTGTGEKPGVFEDSWRSAQSFIDDNGNIDYSLDANAVWCMNRAVELGADKVFFFSNSAPDTMTITGMPHSEEQRKKVTNLAPENYQAFADYALDAVEHFRAQGIPVMAISPINEPQWTWQGGQEGCHYEPDEMVALYKVFYQEMLNRGLTDEVELDMFESGQFGGLKKFRKWFKAIAEDETLGPIFHTLSGHSYNSSFEDKEKTAKWLKKNYPDLKIRCTEWTEMTGGRDVGMDSAVIMADMICNDLKILDAISWTYWLAVSRYDWRDGLLYVEQNEPIPQTYTMTKRYYGYSNFTKFVKEGAVRVGTQMDNEGSLNSIAFEQDGKLTMVLVNSSAENERQVSFNIANANYQTMTTWLTDADHDLEQTAQAGYSAQSSVTLPPQSVMTVVLE